MANAESGATKGGLSDETLRDGIETLAEPIDMNYEPVTPQQAHRIEQDIILDEGLRETFPASAPLASGRFE